MKYTREDICRAWLTRALAPSDVLLTLMKEYGSAEEIYDTFLDTDSLAFAQYMTAKSLHFLRLYSKQAEMHNLAKAMADGRMRIMAHDDPEYPAILRTIQSPPAFLFYCGDVSCALGNCVTIVGSRNASTAALDDTERVAAELAAGGAVIVSGLALGIDSAAHRGCLRAGGKTIGLMACGLDVDYPKESAALKEQILASGGLLMSEYPPGSLPDRWRFPVRNRIMAGLSRCVLMMECRIRSGSMTTVHHALDQGREVYAYPGKAGTEWAEGAHQLLREGANYFTSADDVLEDMGWKSIARPLRKPAAAKAPAPARPKAKPKAPPEPVKQTVTKPEKPKLTVRDLTRLSPVLREPVTPAETQMMSEAQQAIYAALDAGEQSFDQLAAATKLPVSVLSGELTMLQLLGYIKALPGKCYSKT